VDTLAGAIIKRLSYGHRDASRSSPRGSSRHLARDLAQLEEVERDATERADCEVDLARS